jgi:hypothetical protein
MKSTFIAVALALTLVGGAACEANDHHEDASPAPLEAAQGNAKPVALTEADLDGLERGLRKEIEAIKAAQAKAASAKTAEERGAAIQAQWDSATIPLGVQASALSAARYREVRDAVNRVFTTLDYQGKIDGPLSIDLARADAETKARVSGDAFAGLPAAAAAALRERMDRLVPLWTEYKTLVAVAG